MASGKQSKRARREAAAKAPPTRSKGGGRQASPRVLGGIAGIVVLVVIAVVLAVTLSGGSSKPKNVPTTGSLVGALTGAAEVQALFKGIPQKLTTLGNPKAPTTMVEYIDVQCPFCQQFETEALPNIVKSYVRPGKTKIEMRLVAFIGPDSVRGRNSVISAGLQGKAFNMAEIYYFNQGPENSGWLNEQMVVDAAASIPGINVPAVVAGQTSKTVKTQATAMDAAAAADGVNQTPTILVGKTGQKLTPVQMSSATDGASVTAAIDAALQ